MTKSMKMAFYTIILKKNYNFVWYLITCTHHFDLRIKWLKRFIWIFKNHFWYKSNYMDYSKTRNLLLCFSFIWNQILDFKKSNSWYQKIKFLILEIHFLIIRNQTHFLISRNGILDIKNSFLDIQNSISWYQEIVNIIIRRRFTSYSAFLDINNSFLDINKWMNME